jgi:23S rRNA pseudouridine2605 synthase
MQSVVSDSLACMAAERLQKIIAAAGIASRRKAEKMIASGLVEVNGQIVTALGSKADPDQDHIRVNGKLLHGAQRHMYLLMNKPKGYVTTAHDPEGRPTIMDLLDGIRARVYPVGRLDYASEGLLVLTNDGDLAYRLMKAASHVPKVYVVKVAGKPDAAGLEKLRRGLAIPEGRIGKPTQKSRFSVDSLPSVARSVQALNSRDQSIASARNDRARTRTGQRVRTAPAKVRLVRESPNPWYEVTLTEGKNRQIRRMFEEIGHHVEKIKRVRYGPLDLDVPPGEFRRLRMEEVERLKSAAGVSDRRSRAS